MTHEAGIEAAAKAIGGDEWEYPNDKDRFREEATAAIQAYLSASDMALVPRQVTPEMVKNVQMHSELGEYVTSNWAGAYDVMEEYWAKLLAKAPDPFKSKP